MASHDSNRQNWMEDASSVVCAKYPPPEFITAFQSHSFADAQLAFLSSFGVTTADYAGEFSAAAAAAEPFEPKPANGCVKIAFVRKGSFRSRFSAALKCLKFCRGLKLDLCPMLLRRPIPFEHPPS
jgi:hypothetical protein